MFCTVADQIEVPVESDARAGLHFCKAVAQVCVKMIDDGASFSTGASYLNIIMQ